MIALALRITLAGRRGGRAVLLVRALGFALATLVLLLSIAAGDALDARGDRITWRDNSADITIEPEKARLQVMPMEDRYGEHRIQRVLVAPLRDDAPVPPGLSRLPTPGEAFVSPALAKLIEQDPDILGTRYGSIAGLIRADGLADAGELVAISGSQMSDPLYGLLFDELPQGFASPSMTVFLRVLLLVGATALMAPIVLFIAAAARLDAETGEQRLSALRLAGATPRQVRAYVCVESLLAVIPGLLAGVALFFATRGLVARFHFDGAAFHAGDFQLDSLSLLVFGLLPLVAVGASLLGLRQVEISPLGVSRRAERKRARPYGLVFLGIGFLLFTVAFRDINSNFSSVLVISGIILMMLGLMVLGPWLGQVVAAVMAPRIRAPWLLLALRRIGADPHSSFRTISGVTLAVFVGSLFLALVGAAEEELDIAALTGRRTDTFNLWTHNGELFQPSTLEGLDIVTQDEIYVQVQATQQYGSMMVGDCEKYQKLYPITTCTGASVSLRANGPYKPGDTLLLEGMTPTAHSEPLTFVIPADADRFKVEMPGFATPDIIVAADALPAVISREVQQWTGVPSFAYVHRQQFAIVPDAASLEEIRNQILQIRPYGDALTASESYSVGNDSLYELRRLTYLGTFGSFAFSGATAAISLAGGIVARRRPFALLRMSGTSIGTLRRSLITEATLPLTLVSCISMGTALAAAIIAMQLGRDDTQLPPPSFALPLVIGLALGIGMACLTLPLLNRVTSMEQTRFE